MVIIAAIAGTAVVVDLLLWQDPAHPHAADLLWLLSVGGGVTLGLMLAALRRPQLRTVGYRWGGLFLAGFIAVAVAITGGTESPYHHLYVLLAMTSAVLKRPRWVLLDGGWIVLAALAPLLYQDTDATFVRNTTFDLAIWFAAALIATTQAQRHRRQTEALRVAHEYRTAFLQSSSHNLRTPLTVIRGVVTTLRERHRHLSNRQIHDLLTRAQRHADRLARLVDDLTDLDHLLHDTPVLDLQPTDLSQLLTATLDRFDFTDHPLTTVIPPDVRAAVDPTKVTRALEEILTNALTHTPPGTRLALTLTGLPDHVRIRLTDTGPGIPARLTHDVLDPFVLGDTAQAHHSPGVGIGLPLATRLTEVHGGTLQLQSHTGRGTTITLTIPRHPAAQT